MKSVSTNISEGESAEKPTDIIRIKGTEFFLVDRKTDGVIDLDGKYGQEILEIGDIVNGQKSLRAMNDGRNIGIFKGLRCKVIHFFYVMAIFWSAGILLVIYMLINQILTKHE